MLAALSWRRSRARQLLRACTPPRTRRRASPAWLRRWDVRAARMPRVEEAQHTPALVHVSMTPRRQHKHTTDRVCACAPGKEQTALVVRARLGIIAVETRQRTEPVYVHRLRSGSCSGVCPQARSCSHVRRRTWWHANRASLHRGGEGAARRYSAPARAHLATSKLCLAASPRRRDGAQLLLLVYAYAWYHRDIKQPRMCVHAHLTTCEPCSDASSWRKSSIHNCSCATRTGRHAGSTQPLACVHAHLATNRPRSVYEPDSASLWGAS